MTEENEERMMVDPTSRENPKVKELLQVSMFSVLTVLYIVAQIYICI